MFQTAPEHSRGSPSASMPIPLGVMRTRRRPQMRPAPEVSGPPGYSTFRHRQGRRPERMELDAYFLVSQKILSISAIWASSSSATATSLVFLASPAFLVAFQNRSCSCGYFSRCSGLK